ncbi:MAG TPA: hypothetical protein VE439_10870 [Anaerolineae bacterium]|nr:hypothetical protein [Anaerolineae bacterium]
MKKVYEAPKVKTYDESRFSPHHGNHDHGKKKGHFKKKHMPPGIPSS